ncbi:hypothetical protein [Streptomyces sp. NPDC056061]|uniref:hypothetical protein n=1 Tax=Streptomyces sp. NPDC056061 TaxID=3345700 RepID=UPI0035DC53CD
MDLTMALRHRDVSVVVHEFRRRHIDDDRMPVAEAEASAVSLTAAAFRIMDQSAAAYGELVPEPVTEDVARSALVTA